MPAKTTVHWSRKFKAFAFKGKPLRGVHPTLTSIFYPKYNYKNATLGPTTPGATNRRDSRVTKHKPGKSAGILVDLELRRTIQLCVKYHIPTTVFCSHANQLSYARSATLTERDKSLVAKKVSEATSKLWQAFARMKLTPVAAQVPVGCIELKVATAADVVCKDASGRRVVVEIKTGFLSYYHKHTGNNLRGIAPPQHDSPANQHQLQLLLTCELYRRTFPGHIMGGAYIMRVDPFGVDVIPLQSWVRSSSSKVYDMLRR
jgi:hypothetical protein